MKGEIKVSGSKNAILPLIAASILVEETTLKNVPRIKDVDSMLGIISYLGGSFTWLGDQAVVINTKNLEFKPLPDAARKLRASILFAGPMLARFQRAELPYPGGDIIGVRPIDSHLVAFKDLGVRVIKSKSIELSTDGLKGGRIILDEPSVTATENLAMLAAGAADSVEIRLGAAEPHVQDLCKFLVKAGLEIEGIGTTNLKISGKVRTKSVEHEVLPDELEISGFAALAAATHSHVAITPVDIEYLDSVLLQLRGMNVNFKVNARTLEILPPDLAYRAHRIQSGLYPKLVTDHIPPFAVLATQAEGASLIHDWLYEARQSYIGELYKMGANTIIMDPHRALIIGPTPLHGTEVVTYDIRAGMALIIAALVAEGQTIILGIDHIDRGYENIDGRLRELGADIIRQV